MNSLKTAVLLGLLTGLLVLIGGYLGGRNGMFIAFIFAIGMNFFSYWFSDKIVLRMYQAQEVTPQQAPELHRMVQDLAMKASLPMPRVYIIPGDTPNAFATGRNEKHAVVAVTEGIMRILSREELEGVIAHELTHIKNRDILIGSIAATIAGAITMLANMAQWAAIFGGSRGDDEEGGGGFIGMIFMAILAPFAAMLIQMAISRIEGIHGRRRRRQGLRQALGTGRRPGEVAGGKPGHPHERQPVDGPHVHREPPHGTGIHEPLQHPPAHRRAGSEVAQHEAAHVAGC